VPFVRVVQRAGSSSRNGTDPGPFSAAGQSSDRGPSNCANAHPLNGSHVPLMSDIRPALDVVALHVVLTRLLVHRSAGRPSGSKEKTRRQSSAQKMPFHRAPEMKGAKSLPNPMGVTMRAGR